MKVRVPQVALASVLPSSVATYKPDRFAGPANPVGNPVKVERPDGPRTWHPKLNRQPWSYSYAQEPKTAKPKRKGMMRRERHGSRGRRS